MADITTMVEELIAAGCPVDAATRAIAKAYLAGVEAAAFRGNSGGIPVDEVAEKRRAYDRARKRNSGGIPPESTGTPRNSQSASLSKEEKKEESKEEREPPSLPKAPRAKARSRIPSDWSLSEEDIGYASDRGFGVPQIDVMLERFRNHHAGKGSVMADWSAAWRTWVGNEIKFNPPARGHPARPLTAHQIERQESREILNDLQKFVDASSGISSDADFGILRFDPGDRQESVHGGAGGDAFDLPAGGGRARN
jgi:hypothetical protein